MEARYLIIARYAEFTPDGLLNVIGGDSDKLTADEYPHVHPVLVGATRVVFDRGDVEREHTLAAVIVDADSGEVVAEGISARLPELEIPAGANFVGAGMILPFRAVIFPKAGVYVMQVLVDGLVLTRTRFRVAPAAYYQASKRDALPALPYEDSHA